MLTCATLKVTLLSQRCSPPVYPVWVRYWTTLVQYVLVPVFGQAYHYCATILLFGVGEVELMLFCYIQWVSLGRGELSMHYPTLGLITKIIHRCGDVMSECVLIAFLYRFTTTYIPAL